MLKAALLLALSAGAIVRSQAPGDKEPTAAEIEGAKVFGYEADYGFYVVQEKGDARRAKAVQLYRESLVREQSWKDAGKAEDDQYYVVYRSNFNGKVKVDKRFKSFAAAEGVWVQRRYKWYAYAICNAYGTVIREADRTRFIKKKAPTTEECRALIHMGIEDGIVVTKDQECGALLGLQCEAPCQREYIWLDSPAESCRYPVDYKVDHADTFVAPELDRLVQKSRQFARKGCLIGGFMRKCYRRIREIIRLQKFLRGAQQKQPEHFAGAGAKAKLAEISVNMKIGFGKWEQSHAGEEPPCVVQAIQKMTTASDPVSIVEAFLAVSCNQLTDREKEDLATRFAASAKVAPEDEVVEIDFVQALEADLDEAFSEKEEKDEETREEAAQEKAAKGDVETEDLEPASEIEPALVKGRAKGEVGIGADTSLVEVDSEGLGAMVKAGEFKGGPLKWLVTRPLWIVSWLITRIAWLVLFTGGFLWQVSGVLRLPAFVLTTLVCLLVRSADWMLVDLLYKGGWEGEWDFTKTYKKIGRCPKEHWDFWIPRSLVGSQFYSTPANWASRHTGVWHLWKDDVDPCEPDPCSGVAGASCYLGTCHCDLGMYGKDGECQPAVALNQCECFTKWRKENTWTQWAKEGLGLGDRYAYGCHWGQCLTSTSCRLGSDYVTCSESTWESGSSNVVIPPRNHLD